MRRSTRHAALARDRTLARPLLVPERPRALALASLLLAAALPACGDPDPALPELVEEVEAAIADVAGDERVYLDVTREEFVVAMERELASLRTILAGIRRFEPAHVRAEGAPAHHADLEARIADAAERVLAIETDLESAWIERRNAVVQLVTELERDLLEAWARARP